MKNERMILLPIIFFIVVVCAAIFLIKRQPQQQLIPQEFAQLPEKPKLIAAFHHGPSIYSVAFSPTDSSVFASIDQNGTIKLWNLNKGKEEERVLGHPSVFPTVGFSPNGKLLVSARSTLILWDVASGEKINTIETTVNQYAFSPDGQYLVTIPHKEKDKRGTEVRIWDIRNPKKISEIGNLPFNETHKATGWPCAVDISSDGKWIAAGYSNGTINVWDLKTQQLVKTLESSMHAMDYIEFSPNDKYFVAGGHDIDMYSSAPVKGYIMWELPNWKKMGEVLRGNVDNLVFSPDGNLCASATGMAIHSRGVEIWSTKDGAPITSIPTEATDVAFSNDWNLIVTGGYDGIVRVWQLPNSHLGNTKVHNDFVRLVYYLPEGLEPSHNVTEKIDKTIREVQEFYADEMERHGFGRKTFRFETDMNGRAKIYRIEENLTRLHDLQLNDIWLVFADEVKDARNIHIHDFIKQNTPGTIRNSFDSAFTYPTKNYMIQKDKIWMDNIEGFTGDGRVISFSKKKLDWKLTAYSLKRLFGVLGTEFSWDKYGPNLSNRVLHNIDRFIPWSKDWVKLSKCEAEFFDKSRYFNPTQHFFDKRPEIEMTILKSDTESQILQFSATDEDGIHQLLLFIPDNVEYQHRINKFHGCESINGKKHAKVEFEVSNTEIKRGEIRMIDMHGNIASREFGIKEKTDEK